jgi:hypothetical protein
MYNEWLLWNLFQTAEVFVLLCVTLCALVVEMIVYNDRENL